MATKVAKKKATKKVVEKEAAPEESSAKEADPRTVVADRESVFMLVRQMNQRGLFSVRQDKDGSIIVCGTPTKTMLDRHLGS